MDTASFLLDENDVCDTNRTKAGKEVLVLEMEQPCIQSDSGKSMHC